MRKAIVSLVLKVFYFHTIIGRYENLFITVNKLPNECLNYHLYNEFLNRKIK